MASAPEPYPALSGASLPWPAALKEWTRAVQSWSHGDAVAGAPVCALLRAGLSRLRDAPLDALLAWWPAYGRLLKALATHPLVLLGEAGALIVASAVRALRRFSPEGAPPELLDQCRRASGWCAQFIQHQSGGSAVPSDQTDALFQALDVTVEDSQRVQVDDAVAAVVAEVRRRSARRGQRSGDGPAAAGTARTGAGPGRVETAHGQHDAGAPAADDFVRRCADLLARALEPHSGGATAEPPLPAEGDAATEGDAADAAPAGSEAAAAAAGSAVDWSALAPLVAALCFHAPGAVGEDFSTSVADAHAAGTLPIAPCAVAALLRHHPRLRNRQLSLLLGEMRSRPWLSGALPPATAAAQACVGLKPPVVRSQRPEELLLSLGPAQGGSQHPAGASQPCSLAQQSQPQSQYLSQLTTNSNPDPRPPSSSAAHPRRLAPLLVVCGADPSALGCLLDHLWSLAHAGTFGWAPLALLRLILHSFAHLLATPQAPFLLSRERAPVLAGAAGGSGGAASGGGADGGATVATRAAAVRQVLWPAPLRPWVALLSLAPSRAGLLFLDERRRALLGAADAAAAAATAGGGVGVEVQAWRLLGCYPPWWRRAVIEATVDAAADEEAEAAAGVPSGDPATAQLKQKEASALLALVAWMLAPGSERAGPSAGQSSEGEAAQEAVHEVARVMRQVACAAARAGTAADAEAALFSLCAPDAADTLAGTTAGAPADATDVPSRPSALVLQAAVAAAAVAAEPLGWLRVVWRRLLASSGAREEAPSEPAPDPEGRLASAHAAALFTAWLWSLVEYGCGEEAGLALRQRRPPAAVAAAAVAVALEVAELEAGSRHAADASGAVRALVARVQAARAEGGLRGGSGEEAEAERRLEDSLYAARMRLARLV